MSKDLNRVEVIGRLGADPEIKYTQEGKPVATLNIATGRQWKGEGGELKEQTEWHRCTLWGGLAELTGQYLRKGNRVYLEGRLKTSKWEDEQGTTRYTTEIVVNDLIMLGSSKDAPAGEPENAGSGEEEQSPAPSPAPARRSSGKRRAAVTEDIAL
ncbi:MAG: single-stranded DNA-binding protein [Herpetosiphonaceae bacterium]|nr:single-stranded DNA-binding protein [Herpetosiphonaceae bacterium]